MDIGFFSFVLLFLIFCSGFFSASETALFSLPPTKIRAYRTSPDGRRRLIAQLISEPRALLVTIFMLNTLVNILIQNTTSQMVGETSGWILKVGLPFVVLLLFGEIIPKYIGLQNNIKLAEVVAPTINLMQKMLAPLRRFIVAITDPISRILFFYLKQEPSISREELKHVLKTSEEHGVLHSDEAELISGYLSFQDSTVKQLMRPREDILYYDINDPLTKLSYLFVDQECSRLPVCDRSIDQVRGILTAKTFFLHRHSVKKSEDLLKYLLKPLFVPESTPVRTLERRFEEENQLLALVVDEYGSISGLITREDIVEEVIGEISDLRDVKSLYSQAGPNEMIASGRLELGEFNEMFHEELKSENEMLTIGGWLIEKVQEIPKSGTTYEIGNLFFQVLASDPNKIRRLYIRKTPHAASRSKK